MPIDEGNEAKLPSGIAILVGYGYAGPCDSLMLLSIPSGDMSAAGGPAPFCSGSYDGAPPPPGPAPAAYSYAYGFCSFGVEPQAPGPAVDSTVTPLAGGRRGLTVLALTSLFGAVDEDEDEDDELEDDDGAPAAGVQVLFNAPALNEFHPLPPPLAPPLAHAVLIFKTFYYNQLLLCLLRCHARERILNLLFFILKFTFDNGDAIS